MDMRRYPGCDFVQAVTATLTSPLPEPRVLLNARLYKNMRVNQQGGRKVMTVLPVGGEGGQRLTLFSLPSAEKGAEFAALCLEHAPR